MMRTAWRARRGERGVPNVVVSDQRDVVVTDVNGAFSIPAAAASGVVFVSVPDGWRAVGSFWRPASGGTMSFALASVPRVTSFAFVHGSDTHVSARASRACAAFARSPIRSRRRS